MEVFCMLTLVPYFRRDGLARRRGFSSLFDDFMNEKLFTDVFPEGDTFKADIKETEDSYVIMAELPGVAKEDIKLQLEDGVLTIKAERKTEDKQEKDNYIRREMKYGSFERSFRVEDIKTDAIKAVHNNGVLEITLIKEVQAKEKAKTITIE
jgi:HSP20 family protein